uniref:Uncharacterized protein n=1 Tax=Anguilla anguilla TaxID=7936 RepID=A0A0E9PQC8_ANGAN
MHFIIPTIYYAHAVYAHVTWTQELPS